MIVGAIQAYREADKIGGAIDSLWAAGANCVVVLDGAWTTDDGATFGGGPFLSDDDMRFEVVDHSAHYVEPIAPFGGDGEKRDLLVRSLWRFAERGDHVLILDADERIEGKLTADAPAGHGMIVLRNLRANDIPGIRGNFPHGDYGPIVPLIRWLCWSPSLRCDAPGRYRDEHGPIVPYKGSNLDTLPPLDTCELPIVPGIEIHHVIEPTPARVEDKIDYYRRRADETRWDGV